MTIIREDMAEYNWQEGGGITGVGDIRREALVIRWGDSDLCARIASIWSEVGGLNLLRVAIINYQ